MTQRIFANNDTKLWIPDQILNDFNKVYSESINKMG
jgi:hypothetical protein